MFTININCDGYIGESSIIPEFATSEFFYIFLLGVSIEKFHIRSYLKKPCRTVNRFVLLAQREGERDRETERQRDRDRNSLMGRSTDGEVAQVQSRGVELRV